jgi:MFS family permease
MRLIQFFAFVLAFATIFGGLALFLEHSALHYDVHKAGYIYAYAGFVGLIVQGGLIGRLVKKLGEVRLAVVGFATMALGYGMLGVASDLTRLLVIMTVAGFGSAITRPAMTSLITKSVGRDEQGAALGVSQSLASIANIVGPPIAGSLIQARAFNAYGLAAAAVAAIGAVLLLAGDGAAEISGG